ncbi:MAG: hypothetical protein CSA66_03920 [Proteobacteria bacterium]|nr:MAG: hypothetical protein CSA66_03920 [Pseudomonadota bacterium]
MLRCPRARRPIVAALLPLAVAVAPPGRAEPPDTQQTEQTDAAAQADTAAQAEQAEQADTAAQAEAAEAPRGTVLSEYLPKEPVGWEPAWPRFSAGEWVATGVAGVTAVTAAILPPRRGGWRGGVLADEATRDALRAGSESGRRVARRVSDVLVWVAVSHPFVVDALLVAGWRRSSPEVAIQMALMDLEAFAVVLGLHQATTLVAARERPFVRECGGELDAAEGDCTSSDRRRSFFSGHTAVAFTAAGLLCSHHLNLELFGDPSGDGFACAASFVLAGATGALRIVGDQHYLSDVLVGASVGTLVGLGLPWLLHYRFGAADAPDQAGEADPAAGVEVHLVPMGLGAAAVGTF